MAVPDGGPVWIWQVLDSRDGKWGTITMYMATPASLVTGDGQGHNLVLMSRREDLAMGDMKNMAEMHANSSGDPVRLVKFEPVEVVASA